MVSIAADVSSLQRGSGDETTSEFELCLLCGIYSATADLSTTADLLAQGAAQGICAPLSSQRYLIGVAAVLSCLSTVCCFKKERDDEHDHCHHLLFGERA